MIDNQLATAVVLWIKNGTGLTTVFQADQNGPSPWPDSYATFKLIAAPVHLHSDYTKSAGPETGEITVSHVAHTPVTLSINIYDVDGDGLLCNLWNSKRTYAGRSDLNQINASVLSFSGPRNLTGLLDTEFKPRFQGDFVLNYRTLLDETNNSVDLLTVEGDLNSDSVTIEGWDNLS